MTQVDEVTYRLRRSAPKHSGKVFPFNGQIREQ